MYYYIQKCKEYEKSKPELKRCIDREMERLVELIKQTEENGTLFEKIFNNEVIKHNVLSESFFTFKTHGPDSTQLRLLYEFKRDKNDVYIILHKFFVKRRTSNEYLSDFKEYAKTYKEQKF